MGLGLLWDVHAVWIAHVQSLKDGKEEVDARWGKGHKEVQRTACMQDFDFEALEAAIELHKEHKEEDK